MRSRALIVAAALGGSLVTGGWLLERGLKGSASAYAGPRLFDAVMSQIQQSYIDSLRPDSLYRLAVDGMLRQLHDPHTVFLTPDRLKRLTESTTGNYAGLGIQIDKVRDGWITVIAPLPGTPAEHAGIRAGDRIVEIDGRSTREMTPEEAQKALRGQPGTTVKVVIERIGLTAPMPLTLTRREIHRSAVRRATMLRDSVGYVDVDVFSDSTSLEMSRAIDSLSHAGMRALIFDLRGNPGGLLTQGVGVADLFLDPGQTIVSMKGRTPDTNHKFADQAPQRWRDLPLVVLIDGGSASASEIVAGALQDHDRAAIVGRTSFGKGSAQNVYQVADGALKLTIARWYTPSGRSIDKPHVPAQDDLDDDAPPAPSKRPTFKTDKGRTVLGGGGITPDVAAGDTAANPSDLALLNALGGKLPEFRDAITEYALSLKASGAIKSPDFTITPEIRDAFYQRMRGRGITIDRATYDSATVVKRLLTDEVARYVFSPAIEFRRQAEDDEVIRSALAIAAGAHSQAEVLERATAAAHRTSAGPPKKP